MEALRRLVSFALVSVVSGLALLLLAVRYDSAKSELLSGGILIIGSDKSALRRALGSVASEAPILPMRFVGVYETRAPKPYQRRYLTILLVSPETVQRFLGRELPSVCALLGDGVPESFAPNELIRWRPALYPFRDATVRHLLPSQRALKWTVLLAAETLPDLGKQAWLILTPRAERVAALLSTHAKEPLWVSRRLTLRPPTAFWIAWLGLVLLFAGGHLALNHLWLRWIHLPPVNLLIREHWIYHFIATVYFALYLTAIGVIYNRPDFQDAVTMPLQPLGQWSLERVLVQLPIAWLWNWCVQIITVMLPCVFVPPAGIVMGHWRGMVEQALTTAPIAHGGSVSGAVTALSVFWQGEATVVAMVWSALLTRAIVVPHTFGTDDYWQAYKLALRHFVPIAQLVGALSLLATVSSVIAIVVAGL